GSVPYTCRRNCRGLNVRVNMALEEDDRTPNCDQASTALSEIEWRSRFTCDEDIVDAPTPSAVTAEWSAKNGTTKSPYTLGAGGSLLSATGAESFTSEGTIVLRI